MSTEHEFNDRRRHARFELLDYAVVTPTEGGDSIRSVIVDISLGGLQLRARDEFVNGKSYQIVIGRGDDEPITILAEARHSKPIEDSDLFSTGFRLTPNTAVERIEWVEYVHGIFKTQGDILTG